MWPDWLLPLNVWGVKETVDQAISYTYKGGNVVILGVFEENVEVNMGLVQDKEINMLGSLMYTKEDYYEALRIVGQIPALTKLITHRFPLRDVQRGVLRRWPRNPMKH